VPSIPLQISDYIYENWNVPGINKNTEVYWNSWYTGKDDITIHCSELITLPIVGSRTLRFSRSYVDVNIFVTDNSGNNGSRRDDIRNYLEDLIPTNPIPITPIEYNGTTYDMIKIDSILPREERDNDYQNDVFRLIVRLELLGNKQF
jgi:hypothetical protein